MVSIIVHNFQIIKSDIFQFLKVNIFVLPRSTVCNFGEEDTNTMYFRSVYLLFLLQLVRVKIFVDQPKRTFLLFIVYLFCLRTYSFKKGKNKGIWLHLGIIWVFFKICSKILFLFSIHISMVYVDRL